MEKAFDQVPRVFVCWVLQKPDKREQAHNQEFLVSKVSWNESTSVNILSATHQRKVPQGNILEFFLLDALKTAFQMRHVIHRWKQSGYFYPKIKAPFFNFQKTAGKTLPPCLPPMCMFEELLVKGNRQSCVRVSGALSKDFSRITSGLYTFVIYHSAGGTI